MLSETLFISRGGEEEGVQIPPRHGDCVKGAELELFLLCNTLGSSFCSHFASGEQKPLTQAWFWLQGGLSTADIPWQSFSACAGLHAQLQQGRPCAES